MASSAAAAESLQPQQLDEFVPENFCDVIGEKKIFGSMMIVVFHLLLVYLACRRYRLQNIKMSSCFSLKKRNRCGN